MTPAEILNRWIVRRDELRKLKAHVDGATLCDEVLADLRAISVPLDEAALTLKQAATESGFSARHLSRMVAAGQIPNHGRKNAPRVLRKDLPRKVTANIRSGDEPQGNSTFLQIARGSLASKSRRRECAI
jgi:hypothetical protein